MQHNLHSTLSMSNQKQATERSRSSTECESNPTSPSDPAVGLLCCFQIRSRTAARRSWKVADDWRSHAVKGLSMLQRSMKVRRMERAPRCGSVQKNAFGSFLPVGSRGRTQRTGKGGFPKRSHNAVPVHHCPFRVPCPYQQITSSCQSVVGSMRR